MATGSWYSRIPAVQAVQKFSNWVNPQPTFNINAEYGFTPTQSQQQNILMRANPIPTPGTEKYYGGNNNVNRPQVLGTSTTSSDQTLGTLGESVPTGGELPPTEPTGPSAEEQLRSELDAIFSPVFSALQGQESTLRENYAPVEGQINAEYGTAGENIGQQAETGRASLTQEEGKARTRKSDALTSATRLYSELTRGGQQRFGGASSAGEAFGTLTAVEQQRRQATIQTAYEDAMQKIGGYRADLEGKYAIAQKELENQKASAIISAQQDFRDKLSAIQTAKATAESDKATATLTTLQDYRNKIYTINTQNLQFLETLAANKDIALKTVDDYIQKFNTTLSGASQVLPLNMMTNYQPSTSYGISPTQTSTSTLQTGQVTYPYTKPDYDKFPINGFTQ